MNPTPFAIIKQHLADGAVIECIEGKITKLFPRKSGTGEQGEWSFQNGEMADAAGDLIEIKWKGCDDIAGNWKGKTVRIYSHKGDKGRTGLYALDDTYQNKTTRKVRVTPTAEMVDVADGRPVQGLSHAVDEKLDQRRPATGPAQEQAPKGESTPGANSPPPPADFLLNAKKRAARISAMHSICVDAAVNEAHGIQERHGYALVPQAVLILADKIFMELIRRTDVDLMPMNAHREAFTGKTMKGLVEELNKQIADHRATTATMAPPPPPAQSDRSFFDPDPTDQVPF